MRVSWTDGCRVTVGDVEPPVAAALPALGFDRCWSNKCRPEPAPFTRTVRAGLSTSVRQKGAPPKARGCLLPSVNTLRRIEHLSGQNGVLPNARDRSLSSPNTAFTLPHECGICLTVMYHRNLDVVSGDLVAQVFEIHVALR